MKLSDGLQYEVISIEDTRAWGAPDRKTETGIIMSSLARGFVRDSRFGNGQVIKGTNRETTRKWRALGVPTVARQLVKPGNCSKCGSECCLCLNCIAVMKGAFCPTCAKIPGFRVSTPLTEEKIV